MFLVHAVSQFYRTHIQFMCNRRWDIRFRDIILKANTIMETLGCVVGKYQKVNDIKYDVIIVIIILDFIYQGITYKILSHILV